MIDQIHQRLPRLLPNAAPIAHIQPTSESRHHAVWKVAFDDGMTVAVKYQLFAVLTRGKPFDLLVVEQKTSALLRAGGCPVPNVLATDPERGLIVTEWCGDQTLDDVCQTADPEPIADRVFDALLKLESAFQTHRTDLTPHIAPGCGRDDVLNTWRKKTNALSEQLPTLYTQLTGKRLPDSLRPTWADLIHQMADVPLTLGSTDYNARNIVLSNTGQPSVIELAKVGYDWPERRLLQYTTSLGANRPDGRFIGLLTPRRARACAERAAAIRDASPQIILTHLDAHHFIFHLFAAQICLAPQSAYPNRDDRLKQLRDQLCRPFGNQPPCSILRAAFSEREGQSQT